MKHSCGVDERNCKCIVNSPMSEHDTVMSRITGQPVEIRMTQGHKVSKNPFASQAQQHFLEAHPEKVGGRKKLKEWEHSTDYTSLPKKV
jgi:hypothetical protein